MACRFQPLAFGVSPCFGHSLSSVRNALHGLRRASWKACATHEVSDRDSTTIVSWNVNSLRAVQRKDPKALEKLVGEYQPDLLCLQETKLQKTHEKLFETILEDYECVLFNSSQTRLGYSGTAIYSLHRTKTVRTTIQHEIGDSEGRILVFEFPGAYVVNVYTVNAGAELRRLPVRLSWDMAFRRCIRQLREAGKPVIVVGDLNVAHHDIDVYDTEETSGMAGFTQEERTSFNDLLETTGLVDAFRMFYPDKRDCYTYWDYRGAGRAHNRGWRIDYALVSDDMVGAVKDVRILNSVLGSDHCPIAIDLAPGFLVI